MRYSIIVAVLAMLIAVGCSTLASNKALQHKVVSLDGAITRAESVKADILNHAFVEGKQEDPNVKSAVAAVDAYIAVLKTEKSDTQAMIDSRGKAAEAPK